jgi:extracellular factor (EF) 3-hydroxypalmitic acid methyl ester biosynthesis protein
MSMTSNPLWSTLDGFQVDLPSGGAHLAIGRLASSLAQHRTAMPAEAWKASCMAIGDHPAFSQLLEDPYSRDARLKPAGYAGDARTLDYVYLRDPGLQPITSVGRALFDVSTGVPIAAAVRDRCVALADDITRRARHQTISVASIACGHARELDRIPEHLRARVHFWGIDQDARSIGHCRARFDPGQVTFEVGSVRDVLAGRVRIPPSDLVYASGLFDYLDQRSGAVLLKRMFASVTAGGSVLIPNLTPHNEEVAYMEAVMDWWMCYRNETDMGELAALLNVDPSELRTATFLSSENRVAWLRIDRLAARSERGRTPENR